MHNLFIARKFTTIDTKGSNAVFGTDKKKKKLFIYR